MGTMCTPNYANAFTGKFEKTFGIYIYDHFRNVNVDLSTIYCYCGTEATKIEGIPFGEKTLPLKKDDFQRNFETCEAYPRTKTSIY